MDTDACASLEHSNKKPKVFHGNEDEEDRISNLPDSILHFILSFLATKLAVRTSVLSTRWKYLWTSIHRFNFSDGLLLFTTMSKSYLKRKKAFIDFVDRVFLHNQVSSIHKFSLECREYDALHYNNWMTTLLKRKVQEVVIYVKDKGPDMFPISLFTCESLRILKLEMCASINLPASICFPNLEVLRLGRIPFSSDQSVQEISLSCPVLEELKLVGCKWLRIKIVNISAPRLQMLRIEDWHDDTYLDCKIKIYAESLKSLVFKSYRSYEYSLYNLSSLVDVCIDVESRWANAQCVGSLLRGVYNVQDLQLSARGIQILSLPDVSTHMLSLSRLTHLSVWSGIGVTDVSARQLIDILRNIPNIKHLSFLSGLDSFACKGYGRITGTTPCYLPNLKLVDIQHFSWKDKEIWFIKFFMRSAKVMDGLTFKLVTNPFHERKDLIARMEKVTKQLEMFARGSNCVIDFA